ncbi:hypothetical protein [Arthrobacter sp. zg-Y750]|uniref:hypothetical protein n=1 Tax=Arthrobacter sp. zg-Y750 TaxID=2894189 RepID=UPI001E5441A1|nr:hypothetical protein [Arthrobacter sp. zg-Y750]MCC9176655.1 hypothetical protein [Arthrobacter sp. zg-Y750]
MKNLPRSLALAAFVGAFTLSRPAGWPPLLRRAYILVPGAAVGAMAAVAVRKASRKGKELAADGTVDLVTPFTTAGGAQEPGAASAVPSYVAARPSGSGTGGTEMALLGLGAVAGAAVSGTTAVSLLVDARIETWLVRRGAAKPRVAMAGAAALWSLVMDAVMDGKDGRGSKATPAARQ